MSEFINTIDLLGDDVVFDSIVNRTITEYKDNLLTSIGTGAFQACKSLTTVDLPNVTIAYPDAFKSCTNLTSVKLPSVTSLNSGVFSACSNLTRIKLPSVKTLQNGVFMSCKNLTIVDLPSVTKIDLPLFMASDKIIALILRSSTLCKLSSSSYLPSTITKGTGYVYVPRVLVDQYKSATNWTAVANQIRAIEDYTIDGTITGELDESKIQ